MTEPARQDHNSTDITEGQLVSRDKNVWFYDAELDEVPEAAQKLLEQYSKIPAEKVKQHVYDVRERAWEVHPYPCIGGWRFLSLSMNTTPQYPQILSRLRSGKEKLLDLGCCVGQELRQLIADGAPVNSLVGFDLNPEFFDLGKELFRDERTFTAQMIAGDVFHPPAELTALEGSLDIVYAGSFFHLFDRPEQLTLAKFVGRLLRDQPGGMCIGRQVGAREPGTYFHRTNDGSHMFRHDERTWREMWEEAGRESGVEWDVDVQLIDKNRPQGRTMQELRFCVTRK